jgi:hypothetical protein
LKASKLWIFCEKTVHLRPSILRGYYNILHISYSAAKQYNLPFFWTFRGPKSSSIALVIYCGTIKWAEKDFGKRHTIWGFRKRPQDVESSLLNPIDLPLFLLYIFFNLNHFSLTL